MMALAHWQSMITCGKEKERSLLAYMLSTTHIMMFNISVILAI